MSRKAELKENVLASHLERFLKWVIDRHVQVLTSLGVAVAVILIGSVFLLRQREARESSRTRVAYAQALLSQARFGEASKALEEVAKSPTDADTARLAVYLRGVAAIGESKIDEAIVHLNDAVSRSRNHPLRPLALADLAAAYEQKKDFDGAARTYAMFAADHPNHFMTPRILLGLGRSQMLGGKADEARKSLDRLVDLYPTSEWAEIARRLIDKNKNR
jgi:TolA-binding protein